MKVKVLENYRLAHAGKIFAPGEVTDVDDHVGQDWIRQRWAVEIEAKPVPIIGTAAPARKTKPG